MNNKGFTLIELLAVIVILGIVLSIIIVNVFNVYEDSKQNAYNTQIEMIKESAKEYVSSNKRSIFADTNKVCINIRTLVLERFLDKIPDNPQTGLAFSSEAGFLIERNGKQITYEYIDDINTDEACQN